MIDEIKKIISSYNSFILTTHNSPDGDAIGSLLAFGEFLEKLEKKVELFCVDKTPYFLDFLAGTNRIKHTINDESQFDVIVSLDCGEYHRIGLDIKNKVKHKLFLNIDHHASNNNFGDINFVETGASCVGEIIFDIIDSYNTPISKSIAESLYVSVLTDTGSFKYGSTTVKAFKMASRLLEYGAEPWTISSSLYENSPKEKLALLRDVLETLFVDESGLFATVEITKESLEKNGANKDMTDGFVNYPRSIKGVDIAIVFRELDNKVKLSLRSTGTFNVSDFCSQYGGGGHDHAAGCFIEGSLKEVKEKVHSDLKTWIKKN